MEPSTNPGEPRNPLWRSARWSALITVFTAGGSLLWMLVLTRLLSPADFSTSALALALVGVVLLFLQNGLPGAIIFQQERRSGVLSTLFWSNLALGLAGTLLLAVSSFGAGIFFEDLRLHQVLLTISPLPLLSAGGAVYKSIHLRDLNYRTVAVVELTAFTAGVAASAWLVFSGHGYWAAVAQWALRYAAEAVLYGMAGLGLFLPMPPSRNFQNLRTHQQFAAGQWAERLTMYLNANIDTLLIAKLLGAEALGVYDVFKRLIARPTSMAGEWLDRFAFPLMARSETPARIFFTNTRLLSILLAPMAVLGILLAGPLLQVLTGAAWQVELRTFQWLVAAIAVAALAHPWDGLLAATGRLKQLSLANMAYAMLLSAGLWAGAVWGLEGAAAAQAVLAPLWIVVGYSWLIEPVTGQGMVVFLRPPAKWIGAALLCAAPAWAWLQIQNTPAPVPTLILAVLSFTACYGWAVWKWGLR
ncbi:MAG TPA: oligosaccharide flippase family protein [Saprospiraceae bacterium]|nr:oligosaccharide flippase family protein [Saprospiraceae bacterium]HRK82375.1 oligosaccharide flippase family protein [Saprospiraceae bacterium]